jgi:hypothetical protein
MSVPFNAHIVFRHQASKHNSLAASAFRGLLLRNLHPIPREFSPSQKAERVGMAIEWQ